MNATRSKDRFLFGIPKLPARYAAVVMPLLLSVFMTCIVSMISTLRGVGMVPQFPRIWLGAWGLSWAIAFPTLLAILPVVRRVTSALVRSA
ncbi:DUF2798 domain-containing protein [Lysobacter sp.]|uniref:DUF2798 domain-containing protein n=1 Tax=Lysobacter sp. TaxID=72226 RepID=UPI002D452285|nr:DUF2798 domain-containing protein [Lysobacter sp.]HZX77261.1 DUF2798 domain-containing protein [Lysobacter sp.]